MTDFNHEFKKIKRKHDELNFKPSKPKPVETITYEAQQKQKDELRKILAIAQA